MAQAYRALAADFGPRLQRVLVQPMLADGVEVMIGVVQEPVFGPLVVFGSGEVTTEVHTDHVTRLTPLTDADADEMIHAVRAAPLLLGDRGVPPVDTAALADALLRVFGQRPPIRHAQGLKYVCNDSPAGPAAS